MSDRKRRIDKRVTISDPADFARALSASSEADEPRRRCRPATWASGDQAGLDVLAALAANVATEEKAAEAQFTQSSAAPLSASMAAVTAADALYPFLKQSEEPLNAAGVPPNYMMRNKLASPLASPDTSTHSGSNFGYLSAHDMSSSQQVDEPPTTGATFNSPSHQPWPVLLTTRECAARAASSELDTAAAQ